MTTPASLHVVTSQPAGAPTARVVIVHGAMDRSGSFGRVARQLGDVEVVRYDRRGYDRSAQRGVGTLADHVDDLIEVVGEVPSTVFGHSIGGVIALVAAARRPDLVRSLLIYEAPAPWAPWWPAPRGTDASDPAEEAEAFMRRAIGDRFWERLPARTRTARRAEGPALQADIAALAGDRPYDPRSVAAPTIVAAGSDTSWWHARAAEELAAELPDARHTVIAGAQHGPHLSHPTATADLVRRALALADTDRSTAR